MSRIISLSIVVACSFVAFFAGNLTLAHRVLVLVAWGGWAFVAISWAIITWMDFREASLIKELRASEVALDRCSADVARHLRRQMETDPCKCHEKASGSLPSPGGEGQGEGGLSRQGKGGLPSKSDSASAVVALIVLTVLIELIAIGVLFLLCAFVKR